ncbi:hypothetical protein SynA1825c_00872 [Synechococcus sp. A18-25c]|nr:hypothetical protein SynA1560_00894 [Synechococcus sp. A15-60]QNJ19188.1 hypothetical protein SynA1825c_00872 [Synechococcus sp. A18-25c]
MDRRCGVGIRTASQARQSYGDNRGAATKNTVPQCIHSISDASKKVRF